MEREILVHTHNILATTCITIYLVRSCYLSIQRYGGCLYLEHGKALYSAFMPFIFVMCLLSFSIFISSLHDVQKHQFVNKKHEILVLVVVPRLPARNK